MDKNNRDFLESAAANIKLSPTSSPTKIPHTNNQGGHHYLGDVGAAFVLEQYAKAKANSLHDIVIDYKGASKNTVKGKWYLGKKYLELTNNKLYDSLEFKTRFKEMFGLINHSPSNKLKKIYKSPEVFTLKTRHEWKGEFIAFISESREGAMFEQKDCVHLLPPDKDFIKNLCEGVGEILVMTDTWVRIKKL